MFLASKNYYKNKIKSFLMVKAYVRPINLKRCFVDASLYWAYSPLNPLNTAFEEKNACKKSYAQ